MSGLRDFVTGSEGCAPGDAAAGPSNPFGKLADVLLGNSSNTQQRLHDLPRFQGPHTVPQAQSGPRFRLPPGTAPSTSDQADPLVGSFLAEQQQQQQHGPATDGHAHLPHPDAFEAAFLQAQAQARPPLPHPEGAAGSHHHHAALHSHVNHFLKASREGVPAPPLPRIPGLQLSVLEQCRVRDRSTILARQLTPAGDDAAGAQVAALLAALGIDPGALPAELPHAHSAAWGEVWQQGAAARHGALAEHAAGVATNGAHPADWAAEFERMNLRESAPAQSWAEEFRGGQQPGSGWVDDFQQETARGPHARGGQGDAAAQSGALAASLSRDPNPKMRESQFVKFLSKMSRGELLIKGSTLVEGTPGPDPEGRVAEAWAQEMAGQPETGADWAAQLEEQQGRAGGAWAEELSGGGGAGAMGDSQAEAWAEELTAGVLHDIQQDTDEWAAAFDQGFTEQASRPASVAGQPYRFAAENPFMGDPGAKTKAVQLFRRGLLSEAALALEATLQAAPEDAEAWRLLGTVHAENDEDHASIAAMTAAHGLDPDNLDVLLALGVSHTNERDELQALGYMREWLAKHPQHADVAREAGDPPDGSQRLSHLLRTLEAASRAAPGDADLHTAAGVLHHLRLDFPAAAAAFQAALKLRPEDYALWNKLGATLANSSHSDQAIGAYQKALALKPNYMRGWANMGISHVNIGQYEQGAKYYVRALALNPQASNVWGYLHTALACAGRGDLFADAEQHNLSALTQALPLE